MDELSPQALCAPAPPTQRASADVVSPKLRIGALLRAEREARLLSRAALASQVGVSEDCVVKVELDYRDPTPALLAQLVEVLEIAPDAIRAIADPLALLPATWNPELGAALRTAREERGLDLEVLAAQAGLSRSSLDRWESAAARPRPEGLAKLCEVLGLNPSALAASGSWASSHAARPRTPLASFLLGAREASGLTQRGFAQRLGFPSATYCQWELGRSEPTRPQLVRLAEGLHSSLEELQQLCSPRPVDAVELAARPLLARLLTQARLAARLTLPALAARTGMSEARLRSWERGEAVPPETAVRPLAEQLGCDPLPLAAALDGLAVTEGQVVGGSLGQLIRVHRVASGLSPRELAHKLSRHRNLISAWETGKTSPLPRYHAQLQEVIGVSPEELRARS